MFASPEWLEHARDVLERLVAQQGSPGVSFSICEVFTNAPEGLVGPEPTSAAWYFRIKDNTVVVGAGVIDDADLNFRIDYERALPAARRVYPAFLGTLLMPIVHLVSYLRGKPGAPAYLLDLHNQLAAVTQ